MCSQSSAAVRATEQAAEGARLRWITLCQLRHTQLVTGLWAAHGFAWACRVFAWEEGPRWSTSFRFDHRGWGLTLTIATNTISGWGYLNTHASFTIHAWSITHASFIHHPSFMHIPCINNTSSIIHAPSMHHYFIIYHVSSIHHK